ncbi:zinc finger protein 277-like [Acanthaster planci]|uniref:Zinc finger protein 277-like n=1 Tax=Acanthaster planci TaxID=133434 RepID=A0A8B7Z1D2_ACAPL|nr:zinc finger protein 277-like [Acanthaster planci]XP_022099409.1 zinc finger protein 277-like [Acanthaster planci]
MDKVKNATHPILEPLTFPEVKCKQSTSAESETNNSFIGCLLCSLTFDLQRHESEFLKHLQVAHSLCIADVNLICDLRRYIEYWRMRFSQESYVQFCTLVKQDSQTWRIGNESQYYLLSDLTPEDKKLREDLQLKRLDMILSTQQQEREDSTFSRGCLFCREHFEGNRASLFDHMAFDHHFSVGQPNNIVFANEFLDILEEKLSSFKCLYCDKTFKDRLTLKEHMRKKMHKRINPRNPVYDKFYVINYLELGKNWEAVLSEEEEDEDGRRRGDERDDVQKDDNWEDWQEDSGIGAVCLFCPVSTADIKKLETHMLSLHGFDLEHMKRGLNFYLQVKLINYIRRCVHQRSCIRCKEVFPNREGLLDHMTSQGHMTDLPDKQDWDQPQYFFPTYENDTLLYKLEDDDEDGIDDEPGRAGKTPVIAEDTPIARSSILRDHNVLRGLRDS